MFWFVFVVYTTAITISLSYAYRLKKNFNKTFKDYERYI